MVHSTTNVTVRYNGLLSLYHIMKMLCSKVIARRQFEQLASQLVSILANIWTASVNSMLSSLSQASQSEAALQQLPSQIPVAEMCILTTKSLHLVLIYGMPQFAQQPVVAELMKLLYERLKTCLLCSKNIPS